MSGETRQGGRPQGEIRRALLDASKRIAETQPGATWREAAVAACVGLAVAKQTHRNMVRAGELRPVGEVRTKHNNRPMVRYAPASADGGFATATTGFGPITDVMRTWRP